MNHKFIDAQEMHRLHPDTFGAPDADELDQLKPGDFVKVCRNSEQFWVRVNFVGGVVVQGTVDNDLINEQPFGYGDTIQFEKRHVYDVDSVPS